MAGRYTKLFFFFVIFSNVITYIVGNNAVNYITIFGSAFLVFLSLINDRAYVDKDSVFLFSLLFIFCILSLSYYTFDSYRTRFFSAYFMTIVIIPIYFLIFSFSSQNQKKIESSYICKLFMFYLFVEIALCIEQIIYYNTGATIISHLRQKYDNMVSGSHVNANNLATIVVLISYIFSQIEFKVRKRYVFLLWFLIFSLILLTSSRSSLIMVLLIFFFTRRMSLITKLTYFILVTISILSMFSLMAINDIDNLVLKRILDRVNSIYTIGFEGISSNNSVEMRFESYIHFIDNLPNLGFGSGIVGDYSKFSEGANFDRALMFTNPHSYIVEVGYWLGLPGLLLIALILLLLMVKYNSSLLLLLIVFTTSSIPSSIFDFYQYFFLFFMCYFVKNISN